MKQDRLFREMEGDAWFKRNRDQITSAGWPDYPAALVEMIENRDRIKTVIELGCANGFRLEAIRHKTPCERLVGVDCSIDALEDGRSRYPAVEFHRGMLTELPVEESFDLVIVNLVLCWISRESLARAVAEIDRVTADGGFLIIGDHFPDHPQRRRYHHNLAEEIYTYKQDYGKIFEALGTYRELARITYNHDSPGSGIQVTDSSKRGVCMLLKKSLQGYYPEVQP